MPTCILKRNRKSNFNLQCLISKSTQMQLDGHLEAIVEESQTWATKHELISFNCSYPLEWIAWVEQFFDLQHTKTLANKFFKEKKQNLTQEGLPTRQLVTTVGLQRMGLKENASFDSLASK